MRLLLFSIALFLGVVTKAQTTDNLKDFINKNIFAIRSIHKNMIAQNLNSYSDSFKELLIQQESAVKAYGTDKNASSAIAFNVRKSCLNFLEKYYKSSVSAFEITKEEQKNYGSHKLSSDNILSQTELTKIQSLDVFNSQVLNNLTLTIQ